MSRALWLIVLVVAALGFAHPASADLTGFIGSTRSPSSRVARGGAIGLSLAVVGFEFEYSDTSEDAKTSAPALQSSMFNLIMQTPFAVSRLQFYGTIGGGLYRERLGDRANTGFGSNVGAGLKVSLVGPIRVRIDYRAFRLGREFADRSAQRVYVGLNVAF